MSARGLTSTPRHAISARGLTSIPHSRVASSWCEYMYTSHSRSMEWAIDDAAQAKYANLFKKASEQAGGALSIDKASAGLSLSGLPVDTLLKIWALADLDGDDRLNMTEYLICCALIARCVKTGSAPPTVLPPALRASAEGADSGWSIDAAAAEKVQCTMQNGRRRAVAPHHLLFSRTTASRTTYLSCHTAASLFSPAPFPLSRVVFSTWHCSERAASKLAPG